MHRDEIRIDSPCEADWDSMTPEGRRRFCDICRKHVHDLSSMTGDEARTLLASSKTERLCVRYIHDSAGHVLFTDSERRAWKRELNAEFLVPASRLVKTKRVALAMAVASPFTLAGCDVFMPKYATMGSAGPCPDFSTSESMARVSAKQWLGVDVPTHVKTMEGMVASMRVVRIGSQIELDVTKACNAIAADLGAQQMDHAREDDCERVLGVLQATKTKLGVEAKIAVSLRPQSCVEDTPPPSCLSDCHKIAIGGVATECGRNDCRDVNSEPSRSCELACNVETLATRHCSSANVSVEITGATNMALARTLRDTLVKNLDPLLFVSSSKARFVALNTRMEEAQDAFASIGRELKDPKRSATFAACFVGSSKHARNITGRLKRNAERADAIIAWLSGAAPAK